MGVYLCAAAGYIAYIIKPERTWVAMASLWATVAAYLLHVSYFAVRWV